MQWVQARRAKYLEEGLHGRLCVAIWLWGSQAFTQPHPEGSVQFQKVQFVDLQNTMKSSLFIFTPCLPYHSHPVQWDGAKELVCQSLGSRPTQTQELFTVVPRLSGTTSLCLSVQPFQLLPSRNIWRRISLTWPFPLRHHQNPTAHWCHWTVSSILLLNTDSAVVPLSLASLGILAL